MFKKKRLLSVLVVLLVLAIALANFQVAKADKTAWYYPDENGVDGYTAHVADDGDSWSNLHDGAGTEAEDALDYGLVGIAASANSTLYEYYNTGDDTAAATYDTFWRAQTFTPSITHSIGGVKLKLYRTGNPGDITVSIKATDGSSHPTEDDLCYGITDGDTLTTSSPGEWREVMFTSTVSLTASTKYAIVVRALDGSPGKQFYWGMDLTDNYAGGCYEGSSNSGSTWISDTDRDFMFEEYDYEWYYIANSILVFNTAGLPDNAVITGATLDLRGATKFDSLNISPTINIYSANPASSTSLVADDYDSLGTTAYSTAITYANWDDTYWNEFTLNATGLAAISKTGVTEIGVRETTYDVPDLQPIWSSSSSSGFTFWTSEKGEGYIPELTIDYIIPPNITTQAATSIEETTAQLRGTTIDTGGENLDERGFDWGLTASYGSSWTESGSWVTGAYSHSISSLSPNTTYHFRAKAHNPTAGWGYGSDSAFATDELSAIPINFLATPVSSSRTNLSWEWDPESDSSIQVGIYYAPNAYPATRAAGTLIYQGSGTIASHTGLVPGTNYYYRTWPYSVEGKVYSSTYVEDWATTFGSAIPGNTTAPDQPSEWFQAPACTAYMEIPFLWDALEAVNTGFGTPLPTVCVGYTMLWISVLGLATAIVLKSALLMIVVIAVLIIVCSIAGLLPLWMIAIALGMGGLSIYVWQRS